MGNLFLVLMALFVLISTINFVSASDVLVWQGQYYNGTIFNTGTYEFNFSVYDALTGGDICYSNTTTLVTGNFGEWSVEQNGVNSACNNVSKDYYLNIEINGADQTPRRRLVVWHFLRKNINETTIGTLQSGAQVAASVVQADTQVIAPVIQAITQIVAPVVNATQILANNVTTTGVGSFLYLGSLTNRITKLFIRDIDALGNVNASNYTLNGTTIRDWSDVSSGNSLIAEGDYLYNDSVFIYFNETKLNATIDTRVITSNPILNLTNYALKNQSEIFAENITTTQTGSFGFLGSFSSRINKLWIVDINATGNIGTSENVSARYFAGDGSLLTNLPAAGGLAPVYLESALNATNTEYTSIFTIELTPSKLNLVQVFLAQSTPTPGLAIQNRVIINQSGPVGNCNFVTQTTPSAQQVDNILISTTSADTATTAMTLDVNVPILNRISCAILADAVPKSLIVQFQSETAVANVTTYAGSYYINSVN